MFVWPPTVERAMLATERGGREGGSPPRSQLHVSGCCSVHRPCHAAAALPRGARVRPRGTQPARPYIPSYIPRAAAYIAGHKLDHGSTAAAANTRTHSRPANAATDTDSSIERCTPAGVASSSPRNNRSHPSFLNNRSFQGLLRSERRRDLARRLPSRATSVSSLERRCHTPLDGRSLCAAFANASHPPFSVWSLTSHAALITRLAIVVFRSPRCRVLKHNLS